MSTKNCFSWPFNYADQTNRSKRLNLLADVQDHLSNIKISSLILPKKKLKTNPFKGDVNFSVGSTCYNLFNRMGILANPLSSKEVPIMNEPRDIPTKSSRSVRTFFRTRHHRRTEFFPSLATKIPGIEISWQWNFSPFICIKRQGSRDYQSNSLRPFSIFKLVNYFHARANRRPLYWL